MREILFRGKSKVRGDWVECRKKNALKRTITETQQLWNGKQRTESALNADVDSLCE